MPFRFRRRLRILPGLTLNLGKRGVSASVGVRGAHVTMGPTGTRTTVGLPGTGLSYTHLEKPGHAPPTDGANPSPQMPAQRPERTWRRWLWILVLLAAILAIAESIAGCATTLQPDAAKVRVATASQKEQLCESIRIVSVEQRVGPNKPANAMNKALNAVATAGGNGIYVISTSTDWAEGASVTAEALRCRW